MTDPTRLKDGDDLAAQLLRSASDDAPSTRSRAAIAAALGLSAATIAAPTATAAATATTATTAPAATTVSAASGAAAAKLAGVAASGASVTATTGSLLAKVVLAVAVAGGVGVGARAVTSSSVSSEPPPATIVEQVAAVRAPARDPLPARVVAMVDEPPQATSPDVPAEAASERSTEPTPAAPTRSRAAEPPRESPPPAGVTSSVPRSTLAEEVALLDPALLALRQGDAASALSHLSSYEARFPAGELAREARVARIEATLRAGDRERGRALAEAFLAEYPDTAHARRIRALLAP